MDRNEVIKSINELKAELEKEIVSNRSEDLIENYEHGIRLCNDVISQVSDETLAAISESLLARMNRYVDDSLPWSGDILQKYRACEKVIEREYQTQTQQHNKRMQSDAAKPRR